MKSNPICVVLLFIKKDSNEEVSFLFAVSEVEALSELALLSVTLGASLSDLLSLEFAEKDGVI